MLLELPPNVRSLARTDKLRLIEMLAADLARHEEPRPPAIAPATPEDFGLPAGGGSAESGPIPIWSPRDAHETAAALQTLLDAEAPRS